MGNYLVAGIFFLIGLYLLNVIKLEWNTFSLKHTRTKGLIAALILGLLFGLALGPCTFAYMAPVLGVVFQTAQTNYFLAVIFLLAFGAGHCSVIVGAGTLTGKVQRYLNWNEDSKTILWIKRVCGILIIIGGFYLIFTT
jgi:cytochrome c-type biogenesis protein